MERDELQRQVLALYEREHRELTAADTRQMLEQGRQWGDLSPILANGGVLVFPHAGVRDCGHQIAATVHACLDSGAERVVVISVLHAFTEAMETARQEVARGADPSNYETWGIQGSGLNGRIEWRSDHALISFRYLWQAETARRGIDGPEVVERYPYLAAGKPEQLPGFDEVAELVADEKTVVVSTADPFHHGIGYGDAPEASFAPEDGGLERAGASVDQGMRLLEREDYWAYNQHCVTAKSDARDAGQLLYRLRRPMQGRIIDMSYSDATELYGTPAPTWVAAPLVAWERA